MVTDDSVVKEPGYFNIFECGNNILNNLENNIRTSVYVKLKR